MTIRTKEKKDNQVNNLINCLFCKFFNTKTSKCTKGEIVTDYHNQICEKWRYVA